MKNRHLKNSITCILLALFLSMKLGGLHVLTHSGDQDHIVHCTVCDHVITNNLIPVVPAEAQDYAFNIEIVGQHKLTKPYDFFHSGTTAPGQFFSRPPPFFFV